MLANGQEELIEIDHQSLKSANVISLRGTQFENSLKPELVFAIKQALKDKGKVMVLRSRRPSLNLLGDIPRGNPGKFLKDQTIPQARFQKQSAIEAHPTMAYNPKKPNGMILVGALGAKLIGIMDERHIQTVAGNRSGKSTTVQANLFFYDGSCFVIDPKGEHLNKTGHARAERGQKVYGLDPFDRARGAARQYVAKYNPMMRLKLDDPTVIEQSALITDGIIVQSGQEKDPHWNEAAGNAITGIMLYVRFGSNVHDKDRHLGTVRDLITKVKQQATGADDKKYYILPKKVMAGIAHLKTPAHMHLYKNIESSVRALYEAGREEMSGILSTMKRQTAFLEYPSIRNVLSGHDFDLEDLKRSKAGVSVYLVLPAGRMGSCNRWLRIMVNQLIDAMEMEETVPDVPVLAILDEFPVLGFMKQIQDAAGQMAGFHLRLWTILQDNSQGKSIYKDRWDSFVANCGFTQYFANVDPTTTEYLSKRLGKTPVISVRVQDSTYDQQERGGQGRSETTEMYDLMTADEISRYFARDDKMKRQLILMAGKNPMIIQRVEWWNQDAPYSKYFF